MLRLLCVTAALLLFSCVPASAAVPRDGRYAGATTQESESGKRARMAFTVARRGRVIRALSFPSTARCAKRRELRVIPLVAGPVQLVVRSRIKLRGTLTGALRGGSTYQATFLMDGRFPTRGSARGTWALRATVRNRSGRVSARCTTGRVRWRALRRAR